MKKIAGLLLGAALLCVVTGNINNTYKQTTENVAFLEEYAVNTSKITSSAALQIGGKASFLMDYDTKTVLHAQNERVHLPIASMCKIMTLLLSFEELSKGNIRIDEEICVSERAASMGGSQVFLEANAKYPVKELLKSIVVCSANDSCVTMAERIAGNEELFVEKMNEKAKALGANDTLFANCTGLPKEPQYSCAQDVAIMLKALLEHDLYYEFGKVWSDKFQHPKGRYTEITNTNKLVRFYDGCDGGKTGFTNDAGFCLAATAKRENLRIISVVIGEESSANRFSDVRMMFDYAFANYTTSPIVESSSVLDEKLKVSGGKQTQISIYPEKSVYTLVKRGEKPNVTTEIQLKKCKAPLKQGENVGELIIFKEGIEISRVKLCAKEDVKKAELFDYLQKIAKKWNG